MESLAAIGGLRIHLRLCGMRWRIECRTALNYVGLARTVMYGNEL
jgi:hypothetical protein